MKNHVTKEEWDQIKEVLMRAQVPFHTTFDSHWDGKTENVLFDERITVEPFMIQHERKVI